LTERLEGASLSELQLEAAKILGLGLDNQLQITHPFSLDKDPLEFRSPTLVLKLGFESEGGGHTTSGGLETVLKHWDNMDSKRSGKAWSYHLPIQDQCHGNYLYDDSIHGIQLCTHHT
jgi:hypothetical protein